MQKVIRSTDKRLEAEEKARAVEFTGNSDAKLLAKAFEEYSKGGLTKQERTQIEKFDDLLKDADIVINQLGDKATIAQEDGKAFHLQAKGRSK
ncbi:MAG: hypothetical protein EOP48_22800 [Sphingobacteriales bacterium]|nr:MAG: hypothetical protein EOP48_22800 [Sphingobacteriales bacterium]